MREKVHGTKGSARCEMYSLQTELARSPSDWAFSNGVPEQVSTTCGWACNILHWYN